MVDQKPADDVVKREQKRNATREPNLTERQMPFKEQGASTENDQSVVEGLRFVEEPEWVAQPFKSAPLVEVIRFTLPDTVDASRTRCRIEISSDSESWFIEDQLTDAVVAKTLKEQAGTRYQKRLFGLKPETRYQITLEIESDLHPGTLTHSQEISTEPISPLFPRILVDKRQTEIMEPGLTLFNLIRWENDKPDTDFGAIVAIDSAGQIRWSYIAPHLIFIVRQLSSGHLLYGYGNRTDGLIEIDLSGQVVRQWDAAGLGRTVAPHAISVPVESLHHDVIETHSNTFLALSTTRHLMKSYFDSDYHPRKRIENASIIADDVVEFTQNGEVLKRYSLYELLDPMRIGYGSLHNFWDSRGYEAVPGGTYDWSHSNSVAIDRNDGNIIVSVRHQDAVIKIDRTTGALIWILGNPKGWKGHHAELLLKPSGGLRWPYHQHAATMTPHGTLLMFDNGNFQAVPFDKRTHATDNFSRAVEYRIDEEAMKVEQVWEFAGDVSDRFYSTFLCDVDWLPSTGNVLITNGGEIRDANGERTDFAPGDRQWAEIFEVTHGANSKKVFGVTINSPSDQPEIGWSIYRAERIANLFPNTPQGENPVGPIKNETR